MTILDVADAVVQALNAYTFTPPFVSQRVIQPVHKLDDLSGLTVTVVPKSFTVALLTRTQSNAEYAIDIGVQKRFDNEEEINTLVRLVKQIVDLLNQQKLNIMPQAHFKSIANDPVYHPEHLQAYRVFTSVVTVTYQIQESVS